MRFVKPFIFLVVVIVSAVILIHGAGQKPAGRCPECGGTNFLIQHHDQYGSKLDCLRCGKILDERELVRDESKN